MCIRNALKAGTILLAAVAVPATASADEVVAIDGASDVTTESRVYRLADDQVVVLNMSEELIRSNDEASPIHGGVSTCFGRTEIVRGVAAGAGHCMVANPDGTSFRIAWTVTGLDADGEPRGQWTMLGGDGPFEGATGGGTWAYSATDAPDRKVNTISGVMRMK